MSSPAPQEGGLAPPSGLLARRAKNRNKKGLALGSEAVKPGTLAGSDASDLLLKAPAPPVPARPQPIQVAGSSRSNRTSVVSLDSNDGVSPLLPTTPSLSSSSTSTSSRSYHNRLSEQLATLELGVEFKLDLRNEDLQVLGELGCGNGGTVSRALHVPTKVVMAKKVRPSLSFPFAQHRVQQLTLAPRRPQVVHIATSDTTRKQILRELQIMHDCSSPYIVSFYGAYLQDPHICMCMEFMDKGCVPVLCASSTQRRARS